jgi:lipopolysaccharide export system protein LptC
METPKLSGYRKDNRPYQVTAVNAFQEIRNPTQIELQALTARIQMEREGWVTVNAKTGLFDTQKEKLRLVDDVKIRTENGHDMQMKTPMSTSNPAPWSRRNPSRSASARPPSMPTHLT